MNEDRLNINSHIYICIYICSLSCVIYMITLLTLYRCTVSKDLEVPNHSVYKCLSCYSVSNIVLALQKTHSKDKVEPFN